MLLLDLVQPADATANDHTTTVRIRLFREVDAALPDGFLRGRERELAKTVQTTSFLSLKVVFWLEVFDLTAEVHLEVGAVEPLQSAHPTFAGAQPLPKLRKITPESGDHRHPCHDDTSGHPSLLFHNVFDRITHRLNLILVGFGNLNSKLVLELHHEFN